MAAVFSMFINVLHCGDEHSLSFINLVEECLKLSDDHQLTKLAYTKYKAGQLVEQIISVDALKYRTEKTPLLILLSREFLDKVWQSEYKQSVLDNIAADDLDRCIYILIDIEETRLRSYASALLSPHNNIERMTSAELRALNPVEVIATLKRKLQRKERYGQESIDSYAVDKDKEDVEMVDVEQPTTSKQTKRKKKKKRDPYLEAVLMADMSQEELQARYGYAANIPGTTASVQEENKTLRDYSYNSSGVSGQSS